jgi:MFS family permease
VLLTAEAAPSGKRGFLASFVQLGSPAAYLIPTGLFALLTTQLSEEAFLSWGWRVPFLLSILVVAIGLFIRLKVNESETFQEAKKQQSAHQTAPLKLLAREHKRELFGGLFTKFVEAAVFPFYTVFLVTYAKEHGVDEGLVLNSVLIAIGCELLAIPLLGRLTDRVGRKPVYFAAAVLNLVLVIPAFKAIETGNMAVIVALLIVGLALGHAGTYAPQASYFPELFPARARYSGVSVVWQFGSMIASGPFTVVAAALLIAGGGSFTWVAVYVSALILVSIVALFFMPETAPGRRGGVEYADWGRGDTTGDSGTDGATADVAAPHAGRVTAHTGN